jgi:hypothetical protein
MKQYYHSQHYDRFTVSLEVPDKSFFEDLTKLGTPKTIYLNTGIAYVHPKDQFYVKSIGREVADSHSEILEYTLSLIEIVGDCFILHLSCCEETHSTLQLEIRLMPKCDKVHFVNARLR